MDRTLGRDCTTNVRHNPDWGHHWYRVMTSEERPQNFHTLMTLLSLLRSKVMLLIGSDAKEICFNQSEALPRSGKWLTISVKVMCPFFRRHLVGKLVVSSRNVGSFLRIDIVPSLLDFFSFFSFFLFRLLVLFDFPFELLFVLNIYFISVVCNFLDSGNNWHYF